MKRIMMLVAVAAFALLAGACSIDVERNDDGSLQIKTVLTEESLASEIAKGIDDPNVNFMKVDMKNGYALVEIEAERESGFGVDNISFRVDMFVDDGHLGVNVTEAVWNEIPIPQDLVDIWNEELAAQLEADAKEDPDSTLVAVELTEDALTMEFRHETEESKG
ncbi:MAG: hypothetical protein QNJ77_09635 [Acidimicrobiia bacterium]|nr:hypothetical protein [Acidimicrobiia bacterium]